MMIYSYMLILIATHGVKGANESSIEEVKEEFDHLNAETNSTVQDEFWEADSNTEIIEVTTSDTVIVGNDNITEPTWGSNEENNDDDIEVPSNETGGEEKVSDTDRLESTVDQRMTKDDTSSFIEVEEQTASQSQEADIRPGESQIDELFRKSTTKNESSEATEYVFGKDGDVNNTHIDVLRNETRDSVDSAEDNSTNIEIIENTSVTPSSTTEDDFADILKSDTEDLINNSPNSRRMFNKPQLGNDFETKTQSLAGVPDVPLIVSRTLVENLGQKLPNNNIDARTQLTTEASTFESARLIPPNASLLPADHLNQPSYPYAHSFNKPYPLGYQPNLLTKQQGQFDIPGTEIPLFRIWNHRSRNPTLSQQIEPYITALARTSTPPYQKHSPAQHDIILKLLEATRALRQRLAKQFVDWYRRNLITGVNNANKPYVSSLIHF